jgi:hypothetical protein
MLKWVVRAVTIAVIGFIGYAGYDFYRADYVNAPPLQDGDFLLSYKSGLKAVMRELRMSERRVAILASAHRTCPVGIWNRGPSAVLHQNWKPTSLSKLEPMVPAAGLMAFVR